MPGENAPLQKKKRPVGLIILGVLGMIISISGLVGAVVGIVYIPFLRAIFGSYDSLAQESNYLGLYTRVLSDAYPMILALSGLRLAVYGIGLAASIGFLRNKPWARTAGLVTAFSYIGLVVVGAVLGLLIISPMMESMARVFTSIPGGGDFAAGWSSFMTVFSVLLKVEIIVSAPFACLPAIIVLVFLNKPHVKEHYRELKGVAA